MQEIAVEWECAACRAKSIAELRDVIALWSSEGSTSNAGTGETET